MARLPDPTAGLSTADRKAFDHMAGARAGAEGRAALGDVYVRMFNNPAVARAVGALGEHLRFAGVLPGDARELAILRYAAGQGFGYVWAHHRGPARQAGIPDDAVAARRSIPAEVQDRLEGAFGRPGVVELVALCGLYALMGYTVTAFDVELEEGFPRPPF